MAIRILIVDGYHIIREGLRKLLEQDPELEVVGEATDGATAIEKVRLLQPDVVLMDLFLPGSDGMTAIATVHREAPATEVVAMTSVIEGISVIGAIRAGAIGYLLKDVQPVELRTAVKAAAARRIYLSSLASSYLLQEIRALERPTSLTEREIDVLRLLAQGYPNKEIAQSLHLAEDTIKTHIRHILAKLEVQSRTQAILVAMRLGLVTRDREVPRS
jgi:NarL family two-component system response regulator LiaR